MILDRLENAELYRPLGARIALALNYLSRTDFSQTPDGRYELDGDGVFAIVRRYRTTPTAEVMWEAHRQYIDVQYVVDGIERMGYAPLSAKWNITQSYDAQKDLVFYNAQGDFFDVRRGSFAIFTPHDVHAPGLASQQAGASRDVFKVVMKCRVA